MGGGGTISGTVADVSFPSNLSEYLILCKVLCCLQFQTERVISEPERLQYADEETPASLCFFGAYTGL